MEEQVLTAKDFATDQDVRWCPGCGDYSILKQVQSVMAESGLRPENVVFVSGIGCAARFPYYMNTYGMHGIHGRAPAVASGIKSVNQELSVWIATGDGDCLSIGGNHLIHVLRRNIDVNILLFNNEIYGLTKGQYSPTSPIGMKTGSSPMGAIDNPLNPLEVAFGAQGTFIARSMDRDPKHLREIMLRAHAHKGTSFVEIYQNCNVFNDGAFFKFTDKETKLQSGVYLEHDQPLVFGPNQEWGVRLDGHHPVCVKIEEHGMDGLWIHDEHDRFKASMLAQFDAQPELPRPFGVVYSTERVTYDDLINDQHDAAIKEKGAGDLDQLLAGTKTWTID